MFVLWVESGRTPLSWTARVQIALDAARGLEYIHEHTKPTYIHRDIKSANILIDKELHAKVTSFITGTQSGCDFHSFWCLSWGEFLTSGALCFQLWI
jgi:serine/threonine protein kinase